jgi:hypothetical protein
VTVLATAPGSNEAPLYLGISAAENFADGEVVGEVLEAIDN